MNHTQAVEITVLSTGILGHLNQESGIVDVLMLSTI